MLRQGDRADVGLDLIVLDATLKITGASRDDRERLLDSVRKDMSYIGDPARVAPDLLKIADAARTLKEELGRPETVSMAQGQDLQRELGPFADSLAFWAAEASQGRALDREALRDLLLMAERYVDRVVDELANRPGRTVPTLHAFRASLRTQIGRINGYPGALFETTAKRLERLLDALKNQKTETPAPARPGFTVPGD